MTPSDWKGDNDQECHTCGLKTLNYRLVEDEEGHEDVQYKCRNCGCTFWVEGSDA